MEPILASSYDGHGLLAIGAALALVGIGLGATFVAVALLAGRHPRVRMVLHPLNLAILVLQLLDGATTWVGVGNPFDLHIPPYEEQVLLSRVLIDLFGGGVYFVFKGVLAIIVIGALDMARRAARTAMERNMTHVVHLGIIVVGVIPVVNNMSNFIAVA